MVKTSVMAPKRVSSRPHQSRFDMVLGRDNFALDGGMKFRPVPIWNPKGATQYRLKLEDDNDNIVDIGSLEDELRSAGLNLHVSAVESVLNAICDVIPQYIALTGRSVRLGNLVTLKPYATGTLDHENDPADPKTNHVEIRATVSPALRYSLSNMRLVNEARKSSGLDFVIGGPKGVKGEVDTENDITLLGSEIYVPEKSAGDDSVKGRVSLETLDGVKLGECDILVSGDHYLKARLQLDAPPANRDCRLVVETYGTKAAAESGTAPFLSYRRNVRFVG